MTERVLTRLARINKTAVFLVGAAVVFLGLVLPGIAGSAVLLVLTVALVWVLTRTWAVTPPRARVPRVLILALLVVIVAYKAS
jgi:uncharacterized membrane protein